MNHLNTHLLMDLSRERRDTLLHEANQQRILREVAAGRSGPWEQLCLSVGNSLIRTGTRLKARSPHAGSLAHS